MYSTTDSGEACTTNAEVIQLKHALVARKRAAV